MLKEFREFALRGNVMDLAIGIVIGAAFGKIVNSFVNDLVMPLLNPIMPGGDWRAVEVGPGVRLGVFAGTVIDFLIVAFAVFVAAKIVNRLKRNEEEKPAPQEVPADVRLLTEIRDLLGRKSA